MKAIQQLLGRGYFPKELPPPFNTKTFAATVANGLPNDWALKTGRTSKSNPAFVSNPAIHNLARAGTLRRKLSIPNPVNQYQVAQEIINGWHEIKKFTRQSPISLTSPTYKKLSNGRAISTKEEFSAIPIYRAMARAGARYILITDLNSFYPSIYTHSIPWALHGKAAAKANHGPALLGNRLDLAVRNGQSQQTIGIPIGPDTSLVIAEILASAVDLALPSEIKLGSFRYIDDFECGFINSTDAEHALSTIQNLYAQYELSLNPRKTRIVELPQAIEASWIPKLRIFPFGEKALRTEILGFMGQAFEMASKLKGEAILKYAIQRMRSVYVDKANWHLYENLLLGCLSAESGTTPAVVSELIRYRSVHTLSQKRIESVFDSLIKLHASQHHGSEIAWSLWYLAQAGYTVSAEAAAASMLVPDPVVALCLLYAKSKGAIIGDVDWTPLEILMTKDELKGSNWLLAYEANIKGWLPSKESIDNVNAVPQLRHLKSMSVSFFDETARLSTAPVRPHSPNTWGGSSGPSRYEHAMSFDGDDFDPFSDDDDDDDSDDDGFEFGISG